MYCVRLNGHRTRRSGVTAFRSLGFGVAIRGAAVHKCRIGRSWGAQVRFVKNSGFRQLCRLIVVIGQECVVPMLGICLLLLAFLAFPFLNSSTRFRCERAYLKRRWTVVIGIHRLQDLERLILRLLPIDLEVWRARPLGLGNKEVLD